MKIGTMRAVKKGAVETVIPTLDAEEYMSAIFSNK